MNGAGGERRLPRMRTLAENVRNVLAWTDVRIVIGLFAVAQLLDGLTTYVALTSRRFQEANPVFGGFLEHHALAGVTLKLLIAAFVAFALLALRLRWRMRLAVITLFAVASFAAPVINAVRIAGLG
jgi:hypothetical protein